MELTWGSTRIYFLSKIYIGFLLRIDAFGETVASSYISVVIQMTSGGRNLQHQLICKNISNIAKKSGFCFGIVTTESKERPLTNLGVNMGFHSDSLFCIAVFLQKTNTSFCKFDFSTKKNLPRLNFWFLGGKNNPQIRGLFCKKQLFDI